MRIGDAPAPEVRIRRAALEEVEEAARVEPVAWKGPRGREGRAGPGPA